jgi:hypothetical protein
LKPVLGAGGFSPRLMAEVIVQKDIVTDLRFRVGQSLTAVQVGGESHDCQIKEIGGTFTEWRLQVVDVNEGA